MQMCVSLCLYGFFFYAFFLRILLVLFSTVLVCLLACLFSNEKEERGVDFCGWRGGMNRGKTGGWETEIRY